MTHGSLIARGWKALQLVEVLVALVPCALAERTHGLIDEAELLPTDCAEGVLHLAGRYKTVESVEYPEGCTLHGEPGTEVDVLGEVHFLKDARLSGSLVFRGSKHRERQHRCVDVEGSLDFAGSSQVDFISCGGEETEDGGGVYVEQNFTFDSGRLRFQGGVAGWGGCLYVGQHLVLNGDTVLFEDCRATTGGGALFVKAGHYSHQAGNVSFQRAFAKAHGGAMMLEGRFKQYGGHILFEDCLALKSGGGISASMYSVKGKRKQIGNVEQFGGTIRARNCTSVRDNINGNGGVINTNWLNVKGLVELDGCEAGNGGCIAARKGVTVGPSGQLRISNCWSNELGGAIFVGLWMKVKGLLHVANCSSHSGGAVNCRSKVSLLGTADVRFENVTASAGNGGAIWAINVTQEGGTFACWRCRAATSGGAIYAQAVLRLSGQMSFQRCRAHMGGALHVVGVIQQKGEMSFKDCKSVGSGGAIHSIGQIEQWEGSTAHFTTCRSLKSGGAIFAASVQQKGDMAFEDCSAKRSGGAMSVTDATNVDLKFTRVGAGGVGKKGSPAANRRNRLSKYIKSLKSARGSVQLLGSTTFERCWAGAGGALYARQDLLLAPTARALFRDCGADAFGGALNGRDVRLLGESEFRNITALAGGVIQSTGEVIIPEETHAVMQRTSAPQISALKLINMSNLSLENTSHVWFVAPEIHLKQVKCDNGLASFKQPHHVGCVSCEENKIQVFGNPILDDDLPLKTCWSAPRGTAHVDMHHLKLKIGYMVEKANISRSFRCPNRLACMGGEISTEGFGEMCAEGYRGQGCVKCEKGYGSSDSNRFVCVACASSVWRQRMQMGRFVLEDLLLFALSVSGVASTSGEKESKILTNHFMSFVAAAGPVIQAVQETPTFKRIMSHLDVYVEGLSTSVEAGEGSGSSAAGGMSARCIQGYLNLPKNWWCRALLTLFTPFCAIAALMAMRGWRIAAVVGVNCFLPKACLCFARYLVCYRMEPEHEGGELFCAYRMYTGFSLLGLLLLVAAIACSGPVLWWRLLSDKSHSDAPYYLYLSASYKEDLKSWEVTRLVRKVFLAVICAALPVSLHPAMQIMCISLVLLTALILEMQFRPYKDSFWNLEEKTLLTVSLAMVSVTSCYLANEYHWSSTYRTQQFLLLVILVLSIVPTNVLVFQIIVQLLRERGFLKSREAA